MVESKKKVGSTSSAGEGPLDPCRLVYIIFFWLGIGTLLPWNMFISVWRGGGGDIWAKWPLSILLSVHPSSQFRIYTLCWMCFEQKKYQNVEMHMQKFSTCEKIVVPRVFSKIIDIFFIWLLSTHEIPMQEKQVYFHTCLFLTKWYPCPHNDWKQHNENQEQNRCGANVFRANLF